MLPRRTFLLGGAALAAPRAMTSKERIDRALKGQDVDRPPFSYWYHFHLEHLPANAHAKATLDFHRKFRTDLVKVMSDYPYPKPEGAGLGGFKVQQNPFPEQIKALEQIRDGLGGKAYFVETIFNPWNQAEKAAGKDEVMRMKQAQPQVLLDAIEAIARSEANHAKRAMEAGADGIFLAVANAGNGVLSREDYLKFSEPFDRMVLDAVRSAPLNILHLHGKDIPLDLFYKGWPAAINYSEVTTGVPVADFRKRFSGVLLAGIDEVNYRKAGEADLKRQWQSAQQAAGKRFMLTPGCSVPDETTDEEMLKLTRVLGA